MESNLSFLASRAISTPTAEASPATAPAQTPSGPGDFAEVLNGQTLKAQRQHLAALDAPGQGLQVVPLGSKLNIITSDAPLPDMDSLAQFARMQGLDEGAVQALFGTPAVAPGAALGLGTLASPATAPSQGLATVGTPSDTAFRVTGAVAATPTLISVTNAPVALAATQAATDNLAASTATPAGTVGAALAPMPALAGLKAPAPARTELSSAAPGTDKATANATEDASALTALTAMDFLVVPPSTVASLIAPVVAPTPLNTPVLPASLGIKEISVALGGAPTTLGLGASTPAMAAAPATMVLASAAATQTSLMPMTAQAWIGSAPVAEVDASAATPPLAAQDAVRLTLAMPAPEITKRLAQMSGTGKEATWAALLASGPVAKDLPAAVETLTLELPEGFDADLLASATDASNPTPSDLSTQAGAAGALPASAAASTGSGNSADTAQAQAEQRAQQFQQLADKMGQAAAQRLIAQIERGQWKMQMRMQPAALGSINVELDMHAGGLDALFSTDNAVTRELMAQGSNKLRDTLTQAGMTVASVTVNGEQSRQSGGNSTPGKGRNPSPEARSVSGLASAAVAAPQGGASAAADGLNVLA